MNTVTNRVPGMLISSAFGPFNPLEPRKIRGLFAQNLYADAIEIEARVTTVWASMTDFGRYLTNFMCRHTVSGIPAMWPISDKGDICFYPDNEPDTA